MIDKSGAGASGDPVAAAARVAATQDLPEAIGFIRSSTRKMDKLINAILKLSREGRRPLRPERVDLAELARSSAAAIQHQVSEANGTINFQLDVPPIVQDRLSLEHIFGNLFDNAVKYRSKGRALRIDVSAAVAPGDNVAIDIADNGRGIAEQDHERVFELFRRSGGQDQPGEGIGLAHVRSVVRNLGGDITVTSTPRRGNNLPHRPTPHSAILRVLPVTKEAKPVTIVMIEDDEGHARLIEKNIRRAGVSNEIVAFGRRLGARSATCLGPDGSGEVSAGRQLLVLLDLNLPDMTGVDILARSRATRI